MKFLRKKFKTGEKKINEKYHFFHVILNKLLIYLYSKSIF
jgi:hypothetical protein